MRLIPVRSFRRTSHAPHLEEAEFAGDDVGCNSCRRVTIAERMAGVLAPAPGPGWGPTVPLGDNVQIRAREGVRAAMIETSLPGVYIVAEIPEALLQLGPLGPGMAGEPNLGFVNMFSDLLTKGAGGLVNAALAPVTSAMAAAKAKREGKSDAEAARAAAESAKNAFLSPLSALSSGGGQQGGQGQAQGGGGGLLDALTSSGGGGQRPPRPKRQRRRRPPRGQRRAMRRELPVDDGPDDDD